jgi:hypothetical protein
MLTPYQFASNTPIVAIDLDGLEAETKFEIHIAEQVAPKLGMTSREFINATRPVHVKDPAVSKAITQGIAETGAGFVPYVGQAIDIRDTHAAFNGGSGWDKTFSIVGWAPGIGDFAKAGRRLWKTLNRAGDWRKVFGGASDLTEKAEDGFRLYASGIEAGTRSINDVSIGKGGIETIKGHLSNPLFAPDGKINKGNQAMIDRLERIADGKMKPTDTDLNFYAHELRERELMGGDYSIQSYDKNHAQAAKEYGVKAEDEFETFYTPEAQAKVWE